MALSLPLFGSLILAGCAASTDPTTEVGAKDSGAVDQPSVALVTLKLENQFADQFARNQIDRIALQPAIDDVLQAMPEQARGRVAAHITDVIENGQKLANELTPERRAELAAPTSAEKIGSARMEWVTGWGYPYGLGWGGYGAFGFPGIYGYGGYGLGYGLGYGVGYGASYGAAYGTSYSTGYGCGLYGGCYGLGYGGWW